MAPNRKKKKPAANPARGFATVSQPSKVRDQASPSSTTDAVAFVSDESHGKAVQPYAAEIGSNVQKYYSSDFKHLSPEEFEAHLEHADLQNLIDTYSFRCKQEASRQVSRLETERRYLRAQAEKLSTADAWLPDDVVSQILQLQSELAVTHSNFESQSTANDTDLLLKVWTLKCVLEALNFSNIGEALEHLLCLALQTKLVTSIDCIWGLEEVLGWYAVYGCLVHVPGYANNSSLNAAVAAPEVADHPDPGMTQNKEPHNHSPADSTLALTIDSADNDQDEDADIALSPLSSTESEEEDDPTKFMDRYICLHTTLFHTQQKIDRLDRASPRLQERISRLQKRIQNIRRDVLFDADEADANWRTKLQDLRIDNLRSSKFKKSPNIQKESLNVEADDEDNVDILGSMFESDEDVAVPQSELTEQPKVCIMDFGKVTGLPPRRMMEELCHEHDQRCSVKLTTLSANSYSARQRIEVKWSESCALDKKALLALPDGLTCSATVHGFVIDMNSIAAVSLAQAESYLSVAVLFLLVQSGYADPKQINRLATNWRNAYSDMNEARQLRINAADKETLKDLRKMIDDVKEKLKTNTKSYQARSNKSTSKMSLPQPKDRNHDVLSIQEAKECWQSKSSSSGYQAFLQMRHQLPVHKYKSKILQEIDAHQLIIICADTGAGKSTQVPSFILEHQLEQGKDCRILVTQPRRISAISLARRVSQELGEHRNDLGTEKSLVGYAIRLETKVSKSTRITFATTGVLLRMIESSPELRELSYLILDEVHERSMDIDLLFIVLKRLQQRRNDLKIILMSATVDAQKFSEYFGKALVLNIPGRTFPVEIRYLEDAVEDTLDIQIPNGLNNDQYLHESDVDDAEPEPRAKDATNLGNLERYSKKTRSILASMDEYHIDYEIIASLVEAIATKAKYIKYSPAILIFVPGIAEIRRLHNTLLARNTFASSWIIHLLHSSFSTEDLERAFSVPGSGIRKIVIATNIAETGITIPDVTAVIDTCKEKVMRFDERRQLSRLTEGFISRSSARQRRGRAARVQEGLCFHLVTRHRFESIMLEQHVPEMLRLSLQDPILRIKVWNMGSIEETLGSALDPPTVKNVRRAIDKLKDAGALSTTEELTALGKRIARLPLEVILSKLAMFGIIFKCLDATITIIAVLSSKSPFLADDRGQPGNPRLAFVRGESDLISTLNAYQGWRRACLAGQAYQYCRKNHLSNPNLSSIEDQKIQLLVYLADADILQLDRDERAALNRARTSGNQKSFFSVPERYNTNDFDSMLNCVIALAFYPKILLRKGKGWRNVYTNQRMSLVSNSVNRVTDKPPKWLCFYEAMQTRSGSLNVLETSKVSEMVLVTLLGSAEIKFFAGVVTLDHGKVRFSLRHWRQLAAIKILRESMARALEHCWQTPGLAISPSDQLWIETFETMVVGINTKSK